MLRRFLLGSAIALGGFAFSAPATFASYVITVQQDGNDVVASGSGSIDTADLGTPDSASWNSMFMAASAGVWVGDDASTDVYHFTSAIQQFGTSGHIDATSSTGDITGIFGRVGAIYVPQGYVSGTALAGTATYQDESLSDLGLTPGTYTWNWGSGADADFFSVVIADAAPVPEPSAVSVLAIAGAAMLASRVRRTRRGIA
jgi:hypothetical protein